MFNYQGKFSIVLLLSLLIGQVSIAQKINVMMPDDANSYYTFVLSKGLKSDTVQTGMLGFAGNAIINIPEKYKGYTGVGILELANGKGCLLIVNNEDFSVGSNEGRFTFENSKENNYLYDVLYNIKALPRDSALYANSLLNIMDYFRNQSKGLSQSVSLKEKAELRQYARNDLDVEALYTSSLWFYVIDNMIKLSANQEAFGEDMIEILKRIHSPEVFEALSIDLITITEQFGMDDAFDIIVPYIQASGRIEVPQGKIFDAFTMAKLRKGMPAPVVEGYAPQGDMKDLKKTIVIFYDPDCHNCEVQLEELIKDYTKLKENGVQIVSVSSSFEENEFEKDVKRFPWSNKLCDYKGFLGNNFKNYGILSTPTIFLLDKDNKVLGRYAMISKMPLYD